MISSINRKNHNEDHSENFTSSLPEKKNPPQTNTCFFLKNVLLLSQMWPKKKEESKTLLSRPQKVVTPNGGGLLIRESSENSPKNIRLDYLVTLDIFLVTTQFRFLGLIVAICPRKHVQTTLDLGDFRRCLTPRQAL